MSTSDDHDPLWYKDAILYEVHVRAFADSNGDGMGDFAGLTERLDYLRELGVTAIWVLPFYPSPWRDDGYDISDYKEVHPSYGTLDDFRRFLAEAHARGLKVITELVVNHTSDQHPWFQRARRAPAGSAERDFYVWSDTPERYADARIIFTDTETSNWTWDPVAGAYYWHRFFSHQPDLNYDNPRVYDEVVDALDFWMEMGVDGLRLDAVPYLFERDGTSCENLPETHTLLKRIRAHMEARFPGRMLLAEANQWPEDSIAYFGDFASGGDECHMAFHFPVMPRLFMAIRMEDRFPIVDILQQTPPIPANCQWATFLRNHDELTLEMVTDEDRDYMNRVYAADPRARINVGIRRRLAPLLGKDRRRIELMTGLLFSLPGSPVLYYGDEIGMGDNIYLGDRNGVRTPMQWSAERNAGFSRANPQRLFQPVIVDPEYHYEAVNVELQQGNPHSLLWWTRRLIALRKRHQAFSRGTIEFLHPENYRVLAFLRRHLGETVLVVANLSRFVQPVELDLRAFSGIAPVEVWGRTRFPVIAPDRLYTMTLGPFSFFWFSLAATADRYGTLPAGPTPEAELPTIAVRGGWEGVLAGIARGELEAALAVELPRRRWFGAKARTVRGVRLAETLPLVVDGGPAAQLALLDVDYTDAESETYALPLAFAPQGPEGGPESERIARLIASGAALAKLDATDPQDRGLLYDPWGEPELGASLLRTIAEGRRFRVDGLELRGSADPGFAALAGSGETEVAPLQGEQSNSSLRYGDRLVLKLFRRLEPGINPDLEIGRFLTQETTFRNLPPVAGGLELRRRSEEAMTLGVLTGYVRHEGDAWRYTLDALGRYFDRARAGWEERGSLGGAPVPQESLLALGRGAAPAEAYERIGTYLTTVELLGERTAELHLALASARPENAAFAPEPFSTLYQRSLYQSLRSLAGRTLHLLEQRLPHLAAGDRALAERLLGGREAILERFSRLLGDKLSATRLRCHGDYHLGQVLYTGKDFVILDFEGEPAKPLSERRLKRSPLRDVAGMLRSFQYAAFAKLFEQRTAGVARPEELPKLEGWALYWERWVSAAFLSAYLARLPQASFLPAAEHELALLLDACVLEKAIYEVAYELNNRPEWVRIPLSGVLQILGEGQAG